MPRRRSREQGGSVFCCCSSHGASREKKLRGDSCIPTSSVSSALLATPLQIYLNGNQSALDSEGFSFNLALKEEESDFAKLDKKTPHQREDCGTTEQSRSCKRFISSLADLTYKTGPKIFSGTALQR